MVKSFCLGTKKKAVQISVELALGVAQKEAFGVQLQFVGRIAPVPLLVSDDVGRYQPFPQVDDRGLAGTQLFRQRSVTGLEHWENAFGQIATTGPLLSPQDTAVKLEEVLRQLDMTGSQFVFQSTWPLLPGVVVIDVLPEQLLTVLKVQFKEGNGCGLRNEDHSITHR